MPQEYRKRRMFPLFSSVCAAWLWHGRSHGGLAVNAWSRSLSSPASARAPSAVQSPSLNGERRKRALSVSAVSASLNDGLGADGGGSSGGSSGCGGGGGLRGVGGLHGSGGDGGGGGGGGDGGDGGGGGGGGDGGGGRGGGRDNGSVGSCGEIGVGVLCGGGSGGSGSADGDGKSCDAIGGDVLLGDDFGLRSCIDGDGSPPDVGEPDGSEMVPDLTLGDTDNESEKLIDFKDVSSPSAGNELLTDTSSAIPAQNMHTAQAG